MLPKSKFAFKTKSSSAISLNETAELAQGQQQELPGGTLPLATELKTYSMATTPTAVATSANESIEAPAKGNIRTEVLRRGSLGSFLRAAGIKSTAAPPPQDGIYATTSENAVTITNHHNSHIILPSNASHAMASCTLMSLRNCVVNLSVLAPGSVTPSIEQQTLALESLPTTTPTSAANDGFATVVIRDVCTSLLVCGTVSGAAHVTGLVGSILIVAAGQLRLHECRDCVIYTHVGSRPVIEDCSEMRFAALPQAYVSITAHVLSFVRVDIQGLRRDHC